MGAAVTATRLSSGRLPQNGRCSSQRSNFVIGSAATFAGSGAGDGILARRASHTTRDIITSQNGTRSPPLWCPRETMDIHYAHTGEEATGTQHIHPIARFPSIIVIGGLPIILTTLNRRIPRWPVIAVPHLTPTPVAYYGSEKFNDYSCVTFNSLVDNEIRKSTLSGGVLSIIPASHVTSWLTRRYIGNIFGLPSLTIMPVSHITTREAERYG
jgi:hypothetical protein